jgi:predicted alternative tryptophan synthase beta-subunit
MKMIIVYLKSCNVLMLMSKLVSMVLKNDSNLYILGSILAHVLDHQIQMGHSLKQERKSASPERELSEA